MSDQDVHVVPVDAAGDSEHDSQPTCWCQPIIEYEDAFTGARVYLHRRFMDGPAKEPAA